MIYALIITCALLAVITLAQYRYIRNCVTSTESYLRGFFIAKNAETASEFALVIDNIAEVLNDKLKSSLKASLMGSISAVSRNEKALMRDIGKEHIAEQNPLMSVLFDQLPKKWQDKVIENPAAAQAVINLIGQGGPGGAGPLQPGNNGHTDYARELNRYG